MMSPEEVDKAEEAYRDAMQMSLWALSGDPEVRKEAARQAAVAMGKIRPLIDTVRALQASATSQVKLETRFDESGFQGFIGPMVDQVRDALR